jgi:hypothetical protein
MRTCMSSVAAAGLMRGNAGRPIRLSAQRSRMAEYIKRSNCTPAFQGFHRRISEYFAVGSVVTRLWGLYRRAYRHTRRLKCTLRSIFPWPTARQDLWKDSLCSIFDVSGTQNNLLERQVRSTRLPRRCCRSRRASGQPSALGASPGQSPCPRVVLTMPF